MISTFKRQIILIIYALARKQNKTVAVVVAGCQTPY
jgi:hypothetical protein